MPCRPQAEPPPTEEAVCDSSFRSSFYKATPAPRAAAVGVSEKTRGVSQYILDDAIRAHPGSGGAAARRAAQPARLHESQPAPPRRPQLLSVQRRVEGPH